MLTVRERRRSAAQSYIQQFIEHTGIGFAADWLEVDRATVQRWADGKARVPKAAITALEAHLGRLPNMQENHWVGWRIGRDGTLYTPGGQGHTAGSILAMQYERALIKHLQKENKDLQARLAKALEESNGAANDALLRVQSR